MVKYIQRKAQASFEPLAIGGTYPTASVTMGTAVYLGHNVKHTPNDTANKIVRRPSTSALMTTQGQYLGLKEFRNNIEFESVHFGMLGQAIGGVATTTKTHVLSELNTTTLPWFNLETFWDGIATEEAKIYNGCTVDNLTISSAKNEPVKQSVDYIAAYRYDAGSTRETLTEVTYNPYMWHESSILVDITTGDGTYTTPVEVPGLRNWSVKVSNSLVAEGRCTATGGNAISRPVATKRDYELNFTWDLDESAPNDSFTDYAQSATELAWQMRIYRGAADYCYLTIEDAQIQTAPDPMDAEGDLVPQTVTITGGKFDATTTNCQALDDYTDGAGQPWYDNP